MLLLHLAFILFAVFGGAFAARWRWTPVLHLPAVAWAVFVELSGRICPLTYLENSLRRGAGQSGYPGDFVQHYILALIYPAGLTREIQFMLAVVVAATNVRSGRDYGFFRQNQLNLLIYRTKSCL